MENVTLSRRSLLQAIAAIIAATAVPIGWEDVARALDESDGGQPANDSRTSFLNASEAADVEAVAAQIIPTDDTPGAREAGVIHFIDRALATFYSQLGGDYRAQLAAFQAACSDRHPGLSFALLTSDEQIDFLKRVDETPFFNTTRLLTLLGMFTLPAYGGNRDGIGWKLIGFEDAHVFQPPFGHYDRDYPGFVADPVKSK